MFMVFGKGLESGLKLMASTRCRRFVVGQNAKVRRRRKKPLLRKTKVFPPASKVPDPKF